MYTVKFTFRSKYNGVWYPAHTPFECADTDINRLRSLGAMVMNHTEDPIVEVPIIEEVKVTEDDLLKMTVAELHEFARSIDVQIPQGLKKDAVIEFLVGYCSQNLSE